MITLQTKPLNVKQGQNLLQALHDADMQMIPSNVVLNKVLPGLGATHTEITSLRNSIIIEPNVPVIKGKIRQHAKLKPLGIYESVTAVQVKNYLCDHSIPYKKIITTPESFCKIHTAVKALKKEGIEINIYADYFCLFDECEKLNQDSNYRPKITFPIKDFFMFEQKAFVSATPLDIQHPKIIDFYKLIVNPLFDYKKEIELVVTNDLANVIAEKLEALKSSPCICIFYKSIAGIDSIINTQGIAKDSLFFCSNNYTKEMQKKGYNAQADFSLPLKKYNFFTSRYFSAFDIDISLKPDIIIISDILQANFSIIDPFTEAIQIQGRFRKDLMNGNNYNSFTHLTNCNYNNKLHPKTPEQIDSEIEEYRITHFHFQERINATTDQVKKSAIINDMFKSSYAELLNDEDGSLNEFAVNNLYNQERVKNYYRSADALLKAYQDTNFFNVTYNGVPDLRYFLHQYKLDTKKGESRISKIKRLVFTLHNINNASNPNLPQGFNIEAAKSLFVDAFEEAHIIYDAFQKLGEQFIISVDYSLPKIKKELKRYESDERLKCPEIQAEIRDAFELNVPHEREFYQTKLIKIYGNYTIEKKVRLNTIKKHFDLLDNHGKPQTYELRQFKPHHQIPNPPNTISSP